MKRFLACLTACMVALGPVEAAPILKQTAPTASAIAVCEEQAMTTRLVAALWRPQLIAKGALVFGVMSAVVFAMRPGFSRERAVQSIALLAMTLAGQAAVRLLRKARKSDLSALVVAAFTFFAGWRYGITENPLLHEIRLVVATCDYYLFDREHKKPIPGSGQITESDGFTHYHLQGPDIEYDILKIPHDSERYRWRMRIWDDIPPERAAEDYFDQTPQAVAAITANYPEWHVHPKDLNRNPSNPAGLVISGGKVRIPFEADMVTEFYKRGEAIIGLTPSGETKLLLGTTVVKNPSMLNGFQEAAQLGPVLLWPDGSGKAQLMPDLRVDEPADWAFLFMDKENHLYFGALQCPLGGLFRAKTHRDVALQIQSWAKASRVDIAWAVAADGGGYLALFTKGLHPIDLRIEGRNRDHASLLMITDETRTPQPQPHSSRAVAGAA